MSIKTTRRWQAFVTLAFVIAASCTESEVMQAPHVPDTLPLESAAKVTGAGARPNEDHQALLASQFPMFAGYSIDANGDVVTHSTGDAPAALLATVREGLKSRGLAYNRSRLRGVRAGTATFNWSSLARWRDSATTYAFGVDGVTLVDLHERQNAVIIGISAARFEAARREVEALLVPRGVPLQAVRFTIEEPAQVANGNRSAKSSSMDHSVLITQQSTLRGGYKISSFNYNGTWRTDCTAGVVIDFQGARYMVTNSHCSILTYRLDSTLFAQENQVLGRERQDPSLNLCYFAGTFRPCRNSDANLVRLDAGVASQRGTIARTTFRSQTTSGSITIDDANPYWAPDPIA